MQDKEHIIKLKELDACSRALKFCEEYDDLESAWAACERGDWLLWYAEIMSPLAESESRKKFVLAQCVCTCFIFVEDDKAKKRIETAKAWAMGELTIAAKDAIEASMESIATAWNKLAGEEATTRAAVLKECASIVRGFYPVPPKLDIVNTTTGENT